VLGQNRTEISAKPSYFNKFECFIKLNEEVKEISTVKIIKALTALLTLKLYKEQQIFNNLTFINVLKKHKRNLL